MTDTLPAPTVRLISMTEVVDRTSISRAHIYRMLIAGEFPRPVKVTGKRLAFVEAEVAAWVHARIAERDAACAGRAA